MAHEPVTSAATLVVTILVTNVHRSMNAELSRRLGSKFHDFMAKLRSLQYDDDVRLQPLLLQLLGEAAKEAGFNVTYTRDAHGAIKNVVVLDSVSGKSSAPGALFWNNLIQRRKHWCW